MPTKLTLKATEQSTYIAHAEFLDEAGQAMAPTTVKWRLTDEFGTVVNNRANVVIAAGPEVDIVLSGDDLQELAHKKTKRRLTLIATYNSDLGNGLNLVDWAEFDIQPTPVVTTEDN